MSSALPASWRFREMSPREYAEFADFVRDVSGITLNESKRALVARRLNTRLRDLGIETLAEYTHLVQCDTTGAELVTMLDLIATNETHFFRERPHFDFLEQRIFPSWIADAATGKREKLVRCWSAACSTGQEPYSLAMVLHTYFPSDEGWRVDIEATDISTHALDKAMAGEWGIDKSPEIPEKYLHKFMLRGTGSKIGKMRIARELRAAINFSRLNLNDDRYDVPGQFDLIFCRNVLIYFTPEGRAAVIDRLTQRLAPGGLLFVGHAESLHAHRERLRPVLPTVYTLAAAAAA